MIINSQDKDYKKLYINYDNLIDSKSEYFLNHDYFHSHITFSRNHLIGSDILRNYIENNNPKKKLFHFISKTMLFYSKNLYNFLLWMIYFFYSKLFQYKRKSLSNNQIFIQTYLSFQSLKNGDIEDNYFREFYDHLENRSENFTIIANISEPMANMAKRMKLLHSFKFKKNHIITEFDYLNIADITKILIFILSFPWVTLAYKSNLKSHTYLDELFNYDYVNSISKASFVTYVQFLFGKKLSKIISTRKTKIISWNENQLIHRNFLRGIKNKNITVYGCQYFLKYPSCRWMYLRDNDEKYNVIPDKILVCGKEFIPKDSKLNYSVGSPFRYRDVHKEIIVKENSKRILILLPYEQNESFKIIDFLNKSNISDNYTLHYKIHPNYLDQYKNYQKKIQKNGTIIKDNFVISDYKLIITKSSGSIIEYIAQGCTVIVIYDNFPLSLNPLTSSFGLGINYDYVAKPQDLFVKIKSIINKKKKNINNFYENANFFKHQYFSSITDESIARDFEIY